MTLTIDRPTETHAARGLPGEIPVMVTQQHIENGCRNSSVDCAVALAVIDAGYDRVQVRANGIVDISLLRRALDGELMVVEEASYYADGAEGFVESFDLQKFYVEPVAFVFKRFA